MLLKNRKDAALQLSVLLKTYRNKDVLVLACTANSVETAYYVSKELSAEFSILLTTELTYPGQSEYSFGALCEGDKIYVDESRHLLTDQLIMNIVHKAKSKLSERASYFRNGRPLPEMENRVVILIDDALIFGISFIPAIRLCESLHASRVVIAAPVGNLIFHNHIKDADELRIAHQYAGLSKHDQVYSSYTDLRKKK